MKPCNRCGLSKPQEDFVKKDATRYKNTCRICDNAQKKLSYEARKKTEKPTVVEKSCSRCKKMKPAREFRKNLGKLDGLDSSCRSCMNEYYQSAVMRTYLRRKKESGRQKEIIDKYRRAWSDEISERRKILRQSILSPIRKTESMIRSHYRYQVHQIMGGKCTRCGETSTAKLQIDHLNNDGNADRKSSHGSFRSIAGRIIKGESWQTRYQLLCANCNRKKHILGLESSNDCPEDTRTKTCSQCKLEKPIGLYAKSKDRPNRVSYCKECGRSYSKHRRIVVLKKLGNQCVRCGESDQDVLEIDHLHNDGANLRRSRQDHQITTQIYSNRRNLDDLQLLCANCNAEKGYNFVRDSSRPQRSKDLATYNFLDFDIKSTRVVRATDPGPSRDLLNAFHYIGFGRSWKAIYEARLGEELIAVIKVSTPIRKEVATSMGLQVSEVLEIDRVCIHPARQKKNLASFMLSKTIKLIRQDFPGISLLVSFADSAQGHEGTIYKAANWKFVGFTGASYYYVDDHGLMIPKKTLYGRARFSGIKEKDYAESHNLRKVPTPPKSKFVYRMNP